MGKILLFLTLTTSLFGNPFLIDVPKESDWSEKDWIAIQEKLKAVDINPLLDSLYPETSYTSKLKTLFGARGDLQKKEDFKGRVNRGIRQTLLNVEKQELPQKNLIKINGGGSRCIVSFASYDGVYADLLKKRAKELEEVGFNGYFLTLIGGFPNPTGEEIQYAGVPYSFKIFALLEAKNLGFLQTLWIDTSLKPLKDPSPLFEKIEKNGSFFQLKKNGKRYLLPTTREVLLKETGSDMYLKKCIRARIIGLDLSSPKVEEFIQEYYRLVRLGTPFISCFPEEFVIGAILAKDPLKWTFDPTQNLVMAEKKHLENWAKDQDFFFFLENH
jgi:hypothetical protein